MTEKEACVELAKRAEELYKPRESQAGMVRYLAALEEIYKVEEQSPAHPAPSDSPTDSGSFRQGFSDYFHPSEQEKQGSAHFLGEFTAKLLWMLLILLLGTLVLLLLA